MKQKGTLAAGMQADLVVLTQDVFTVAPDALPATEAWLTVIGGQIAYTAEANHYVGRHPSSTNGLHPPRLVGCALRG